MTSSSSLTLVVTTTPTSSSVASANDYDASIPSSHDSNYDDDDEVGDDSGGCFFADATLDLDNARCIEETPEVTVRTFANNARAHEAVDVVLLPNLDTMDSTSNNITSTPNSKADGKRNRESLVMETSDNNQQEGESKDDSNDKQQKHEQTIIRPQRIDHPTHISNLAPTTQPKPPRRPRDTSYTLFFLTATLLLFFLPCPTSYSDDNNNNNNINNKVQIHHILFPTLSTTAFALILARIIYCSRGGNEGDDRRYTISTLLFISDLITCLSLPILTLKIYYLNISNGDGLFWWYHPLIILLIMASAYHVIIFAKLFSADYNTGAVRTSTLHLDESINDGHRTLFRMLVNVSLDVLSRSLRPSSIYRFFACWIVLQCGLLLFIVHKMLNCNSNWALLEVIMLMISLWVVFFMMKIMSMICSGGITAWFAQQSLMMEQMERMRRVEEGDLNNGLGGESFEERTKNMPEAYKNVNANAYRSHFEFDEGMDDDFDYDDDEKNGMISMTGIIGTNRPAGNTTRSGSGGGTTGVSGDDWQNVTVKSFLLFAFTTSFGSVAHSALLGPLSNLIENVVQLLDRVISTLTSSSTMSNVPRRRRRQEGFQGMDVAGAGGNENLPWREKLYDAWKGFESRMKAFITNHYDLGLCHVAAYHKSYQKGSNDVMALVNASG